MSIKTVLTITGPEQSKIDLRLAAQLCGEIRAHLSVMVTAFALPPPIGDYPPAGEDWIKQRDRDLTNLRRRTGEVTRFLVDTILSADVTDAYPDRGLGDDVIGRRARYADITLLGPEVLADEWLKRKSIEGVLFHSGKPLLLAPLESSPTMKPRRVLVAWDSLLASSRAVREALDLITGADETRIVLIDPAKGEMYHGDEPGADIAAYLTRHGARITIDRLPGGKSVCSRDAQGARDGVCSRSPRYGCLRPLPIPRIPFRRRHPQHSRRPFHADADGAVMGNF